jgi:hypothetical protein
MLTYLKRQIQQLSLTIKDHLFPMFFYKLEKKCSTLKTLSHKHHLLLTSSSHHRFRLLSLLHLPKKMILMTLLPFRQVNSQLQRHNAYTITPLCPFFVASVLSSHHRHHNQ